MRRQPQQTIVAVLNDLIFGTKIRSTANSLGISVSIIGSAAELSVALDRVRPSLVIVDLDSIGASALDVVGIAVSHPCGPHVVAYLSHVNTELATRARDAGASAVMPRSRFSSDLPKLLRYHQVAESDNVRSSDDSPRVV